MKLINVVLIYINLFIIFLYNLGTVEGIVGGQLTAVGQYTYPVSIQVNNIHICGGTLIDGEYVLTAANCFVNHQNQIINRIYTVVVNAIDLSVDPNRYRVDVSRIYIPTAYIPNNISNEDVAILELVEVISLPTRLYLPSIPNRNNERAVEGLKTVIGYGLSITDRYDVGRDVIDICNNRCVRLRFAAMNIVPNNECPNMNGGNVEDGIICAKIIQYMRGTGGVCYGDVGNALVSGNVIIGVLIRNRADCNETDLPAYYSKVINSMPFITHVLDNPIYNIVRDVARYAYYNRAGNIIEV